MTEYNATATRDGDHWLVKVPGSPGPIGYAEDNEHAVRMARDHIAFMYDIPTGDVEVQVIFQEPVTAPWDAMVGEAMEILRRDSGYPSVAAMDRDMPVWRQQCEEIVTAMLTVLLGQVESSIEDDGRRCPRCKPDNSCTLWCLESMISENITTLLRELFDLRRERDRLQAALESTEYADLMQQYTTLVGEFNKAIGERCGVFTCDHLASVHGDMGCEFCSCHTFLRRTPK